MSYNVGCIMREGRKADRDGKAVALLRRAGAIPFVISNQSELCIGPETHNILSGRTTNPYCRQRSVGGASGGEVNTSLYSSTFKLSTCNINKKNI